MRFFAFFLPQFHTIPENDEWWGKGFTEWTNVKKAKSLGKGHLQPIHPLNNNYYNLLDKETVRWQTQVMRKYGITGMIYYHYYFLGKLLLEKPAENLLIWKDINQPFFFCWANHSWKKTWDGTSSILLKQEYGTVNDWENHFQYLLPFFKDDRYEKKNNMPVFMIFDSFFSQKKEMVNYFNMRCIEEGFDGIYWINNCFGSTDLRMEKIRNDMVLKTEKIYLREPSNGLSLFERYERRNILAKLYSRMKDDFLRKRKRITQYDGSFLFKLMIKNYENRDYLIHGLFLSWDNSPRHGRRGYVISEVNKQALFNYLDLIKGEEYCFINAWNEWCEGMILEPTEERGFYYLEMINEWIKQNNLQ